MTRINLVIDKGFKWYSNNWISVKGCFHDQKNNLYQFEKLVSFFTKIDTKEQFIKKIKEINGFFTVVIKLNNHIYIASDTTRIFPLFYTYKGTNIIISDDIEFLKKSLNITEFDKQSSIEFISAGHTLGSSTLLKDIFQTQSNEYLIFKENKILKQGFFFNYSTNKTNKTKYSELTNQAVKVFDNSFKRLITSLNNCPVALPLSGGFDSRLIALMLRKHNYKNVTCYTYGKKGNHEIENSKKTAEALGFKWVFIEYSNDLIDDYINTKSFLEYVKYIGKYSSCPFLQEYFSVKYLTDNKLISPNTIFIPGFAGDLLGGSQYSKIPSKIKSISNYLLKNKFFHNTLANKSQIENNILSVIKNFDKNYKEKISTTIIEDFDIKEKISKIIFNSAGVFTFFNYEHRFPYWDKELLFFYKDIPIEYKLSKYLYDDVLKNRYFEEFELNFETELQPAKYKFQLQKIKNLIKPIFPKFIRHNFLIKNDWLNSNKITSEMQKSMVKNNIKINPYIKTFNEVNIMWYFNFSKGKIKT